MHNDSPQNNTSPSDAIRYSIITIDSQILAIRQDQILSIETIHDLDTNNEIMQGVPYLKVMHQKVPVFHLDDELAPIIAHYPTQRRACIVFKSNSNNLFAISVNEVKTLSAAQVQIFSLPDYMLTSSSVVNKVICHETETIGILDTDKLQHKLQHAVSAERVDDMSAHVYG